MIQNRKNILITVITAVVLFVLIPLTIWLGVWLFEDRKYNLVLVWGKITINEDEKTLTVNCDKGTSINDFITDIKSCLSKNLLTKDYSQLKKSEIPRYYMQARYGSMYSKNKHIRVYSYFADAVLFSDGELWRDA